MRFTNPRDALIELTRLHPCERFEEGRPRVPDDIVERMKAVTTKEAWGVLRKHGYTLPFEGGWLHTHPGRIVVGRAVTAVFVPKRPDVQELVEQTEKGEGRVGGMNSWVIDTLQTGDVMVVDMFGKDKEGTFVGDNLGTSVVRRTKAGAVIHGSIRDYQGLTRLDDVAIFCQSLHPSAILDVTLAGINVPVRIGEATALPGDVVLGTPAGVICILPQLAQEVVERSEGIRVGDQFGHQRLRDGRYTPGEIDRIGSTEIEADFQA